MGPGAEEGKNLATGAKDRRRKLGAGFQKAWAPRKS